MSLALGHRVKKDKVSTLKEIVVLGNKHIYNKFYARDV